jgi:thiamine-phosphate pyrophosphorylase
MELPKLYAITDRKAYGTDFLQTLRKVLERGIKLIQLREKELPDSELYELATEVRKLTRRYNAMLLINGRFDIALAVGAEGVHLPENSLPPSVVKSKYPQLIVGFSAHSLESALYAQRQGADFITLSPLFKTSSHPETKPLGVNRFRDIVKELKIPVYALGGINWNRIKTCYKAGAYGIAGIKIFIT